MKKFLSAVLVLMLALQMLMVVSFAEDINTIPQVGQMEIKPCSNNFAVGLRTNGTINVYGVSNVRETETFRNQVKMVTNAVSVACTQDNLVFVLKDTGRVEMLKVYEDIDTYPYDSVVTWENIVAIESGSNHVVGLKTDGTVVAAGPNSQSECAVDGFKNITSIHASNHSTFCLDKDGKVFSAGVNPYIEETSSLTNVKDISVSGLLNNPASSLVVLTNDGDVFVAGVYPNGTTLVEAKKVKEEHPFYQQTEDGLMHLYDAKIGKLVDIHASEYIGTFYGITEQGDCYLFTKDGSIQSLVASNAVSVRAVSGGLVSYPNQYFVLDKNGKIHSSIAFQSDSWILTTNITYNGNKVESDVPPYIKDGRTLAPIRAILETLGMQVSWDDVTQTATAVKDGITITVTIDSNIATVNGEQKILDVPAEITRDRTFVPVRFFVESLNMKVDWDQDTQTVIITQE